MHISNKQKHNLKFFKKRKEALLCVSTIHEATHEAEARGLFEPMSWKPKQAKQ